MNRAYFLGATILFCALSATRAQAAAEFCPATLVGEMAQIDAQTYRLRLGGISPRIVTGIIHVQTPGGWYSVAFNDVPFRSLKQDYNDQGMSFTHEDYLSNDIVVRFPKPASVTYAYVSQAQTRGETFLNWDKYGPVSCDPTPFAPRDKRNTARPMPPLSKDPVQLGAVPIETPLKATCEKPFDDVLLKRAGPYHYPSMYGRDDPMARPIGTTVVVVAVDRDGSIVDAWVWESAQTPLLDQSVLDEARKSTFTPGRAFCQAVPGYFVLRSVFTQ